MSDTPSTISKAPKNLPRDLKDPHALPDAPRGIVRSTREVRELETGAPKGRGPDGQIINPR